MLFRIELGFLRQTENVHGFPLESFAELLLQTESLAETVAFATAGGGYADEYCLCGGYAPDHAAVTVEDTLCLQRCPAGAHHAESRVGR